MKREYLCRVHTVHYFCNQYTWNVLIFTPSQNGPWGEQTLWRQKLYRYPSSAKTQHNQEHNTMGSHSIIFEMALSLLWPQSKRQHNTCPVDIAK